MSEVTLRQAYYEGRVVIEAARILDSPFDDSFICLTGAELELIRNLTMYLHRRSSFVDTYYDGYYSMPDDEDWDDISAIVASLEEKLMGCVELEALLADIAARLLPEDGSSTTLITSVGAAQTVANLAAIAADKIQTVKRVTFRAGDPFDYFELRLLTFDPTFQVWRVDNPIEHVTYAMEGELFLTEGQYLQCICYGLSNGKTTRVHVNAEERTVVA